MPPTFFIDRIDGTPMAEDCIFCEIVDGSIPSRTVYEDEQVQAFLDVNPLSRGHTVVIPTGHHETIADLPTAAGEALFTKLPRLVPAIEGAVDADGSTVGFNNGSAAGQEIPHVHGHIIPRFRDDSGGNLHTMMGQQVELSDDEFERIATNIQAAL